MYITNVMSSKLFLSRHNTAMLPKRILILRLKCNFIQFHFQESMAIEALDITYVSGHQSLIKLLYMFSTDICLEECYYVT